MAVDEKKKASEPAPIDEAPKAEPVVKGYALAGIKASGKRYQRGDALELPESRFDALLEQGLVGLDRPLADGEVPPLAAGAKSAVCRALRNVKISKVTHKPGDLVDVPAAFYIELVQCGAVTPAG